MVGGTPVVATLTLSNLRHVFLVPPWEFCNLQDHDKGAFTRVAFGMKGMLNMARFKRQERFNGKYSHGV